MEYWKEAGQSNNTGAGGRNKEEYRERISYGSEVTNYLFKGGDAYDLEKIHITRMATNKNPLKGQVLYGYKKYIINWELKQDIIVICNIYYSNKNYECF